MEFVRGLSIGDIDALEKNKFDKRFIAYKMADIFNR
jgi:predicted unusual protein kinase regulating ubiquinone biosynthesis (AarF/ABC1/UbiB family)